LIALVTTVLGLAAAAIPIVSHLTGSDKSDPGPGPTIGVSVGGAAITVNNVIVQPGEYHPPPPAEGASDVDPCLVGHWVGTAYTRSFQVDQTLVDLQAPPDASFATIFRDDGTGTDTTTGTTALTGSAGDFTVTMEEAGTSLFKFVGRDGELAVQTTSEGIYQFSVVINGEDIPKDKLQYSPGYTIKYMCSTGQLILTGDSFRLEYARA